MAFDKSTAEVNAVRPQIYGHHHVHLKVAVKERCLSDRKLLRLVTKVVIF